MVSTRQLIRPAGRSVEFGGRPVDLVASGDGTRVYVKDNRGVVVLDADSWEVLQELPFPEGGGSMHGIALSADGRRLYATTAQEHLYEANVGDEGLLSWSRTIPLPGPGGEGPSHSCGIALSADGTTAFVALSRNNSIGEVDLARGAVVREIPVGVAPFDVAIGEGGASLYVSNWGGRRPVEGEQTAPSSGTPVLVDDRGVARSGTVGKVDFGRGAMVAEVATGLHPSDLVLDADAGRLYVANANSDTVTILDVSGGGFEERASILVRPDPDLPFGSASNALALSADGGTLYVANGGNNAVAVVSLGEDRADGHILGFIPAAWYPGGLAIGPDGALLVSNVKGLGSRAEPEDPAEGRSVYAYLGTVQRVEPPDAGTLARFTEQVVADARVPQALLSWERQEARSGAPPRPVPERLGEPSVFEHVVYVIKENRTYDQVFGDMPQGDGDPSLCIFGREVTPNHHKLAEEFVLLDNFYCNGVLSADGHSWTTEGNVTDHLEKSFGGFTRSYTFGDDPLTYSSTGFIWDNVLLHGLSFRNYGEMDYAEPVPDDLTFTQIYEDFLNDRNEVAFTQNIGIEPLRRYSSPSFPGWNMKIPDVLRADRFLDELAGFEETGDLPGFSMIFLPQDHGSGTSPGMPTPSAHMADNDLAVGRIVEGLSKSRFWPKTCVFVIEDDPQNGFDHVDGHRSICLVASPYTKRGEVISEFYNQTSVLHTMERILGLPPMNQMDAMSPLMSACFADEPDLTPYEALPANIPLDELNKPVAELPPGQRKWAEASLEQDFEGFDRADEDTLNRILWHFAKGPDAPYPAHLAGAHGTGLEGRRLVIVEVEDDDDEEEEDEDD
ncbi:bifunctional YncE family protein/alkaline phosphatase family protein [Tautonia plasticadhaerens]|uniref:Phosphoesterase family protein n=1 Tax=Tautonia plasticadhaerens TaxID=2527974 RepID=A0A518GUN6_9BACT|nr:bifunctional YncE family protein/alkaline phosphatase family protein [Tautonia plasticadhaerens]QDV32291.1 Phosphoesterase family protein [Tautonia plasticadhaerens]